MKVGTLTGGGDTAALNATLKGIALACQFYNYELIGFVEGWWGVLNNEYFPLSPTAINQNRGGSILKCSRTNLLKAEGGIEKAFSNLKALGIDALVPIGGDDTLTVATKFNELDLPVNCITKTIDNDLGINAPAGPEVDFAKIINYYCPGFPTAAKRLSDYISDLQTTVYSHNRIVVVEVMGRHHSWLALATAYGHPDFILTAELGLDYEKLVEKVHQRYLEQGNVIIVVPEGLRDESGKEITLEGFYKKDQFGREKLGGVGEVLASRLKETLADVLEKNRSDYCHGERVSYWQRAGSPIPIDCRTARRLGEQAVQGVRKGEINKVVCVMRRGEELRVELLGAEEVLLCDEKGRVIPRQLDLRFYDKENYSISPLGLEYFRPILGELPENMNPKNQKPSRVKKCWLQGLSKV